MKSKQLPVKNILLQRSVIDMLHRSSGLFIGFALLCLLLFFSVGLCAQECTENKSALVQNDEFFPPSMRASSFVNFDGKGFVINGKRVFLVSGTVHYSRVPRENWRDILLKLKRSGFNTVETYIFWNYHEMVEGKYDFTSDNRNLGAFLDEAKRIGLYAIVRVGPYICGEWENGGFPNWLSYKPNLEIRKNNQSYFKSLDIWFNKMLPMISERQVYKGGNVILVQLENEMPTNGWCYWGKNSDGNYMNHLMDLAKQNDLEVPMIFSGIHHAHNPAPDEPIDVALRKSPWMSMELWTIWFDRYGTDLKDLMKGERSCWRVLSQGGAGFNLYMYYGGTTFGFYNFNNETRYGEHAEKGTACYDYGTLIGQSGETRDLYYRLKRLAYQTETFSPLLAQSVIDTVKYRDFCNGACITSRVSPDGTLIFLNNKGGDTTAVLKSGVSVKLAAKEIAAFPMNVRLTKNVFIKESSSRILGIVKQRGLTTVVCFGESGDKSKLTFNAIAHKDSSLSFTYPKDGVGEQLLSIGNEHIRILTLSKETADKTWFVDTPSGRLIVVGAPYLGEFKMISSNKIYAEIDYPYMMKAPKSITVYSGSGSKTYLLPSSQTCMPLINHGTWQMALYDMTKNCENHDGYALPDGTPPEMGMNNNNTPYAWYYTRFRNDSIIVSLIFKKIGDCATFFVDGKMIAEYNYTRDQIAHVPVRITPGWHDLSAFVSHFGRSKLSGYVGPINTLEFQKGLRGPVFAEQSHSFTEVGNWKMRGGVFPNDTTLKWTAITVSNNVPAYFRTSFVFNQKPESGIVYRLVTDGLSAGNVWLNGHNLGRYPELVKMCPGMWLPSCWMKKGMNELVIFDEKGYSPEKTQLVPEYNVCRKHIIIDDKKK